MNKKLQKWLDGSLFSYRRSYALTHPWIFVGGVRDEVIYAWERVFKGYDGRVSWSVDYYLAKHIPLWVKEVKEFQGFPVMMYEDNEWQHTKEEDEIAKNKWNSILDSIIEGFESYLKMDGISWENWDKPEYLELQKKYELGFDNFRKYFSNLWT